MVLGIIVALEFEINGFLKKYQNNCQEIKILNHSFFEYQITSNHKKIKFVLSFSDVAKTNASSISTLMFANYPNIKTILNVGTCGAYSKHLNVLDAILVDKTQYLDVDLTAFNYNKNQIPRKPTLFDLSQIHNNDLYNDKNFSFKYGICGTSDTFLNKDNISNYISNNTKVDIIDMELCAIAQVCFSFKKDLVAIKLISDHINHQNKNELQFYENMDLINQWFSKHLLNIISNILNNINKE